MHARLLAVVLVLVSISVIAHAEVNLPTLSGTAVRSVVFQEENPLDAFRYFYRVDNSSGALPVMFMALDLQSDPFRVVVGAEGFDDIAGSHKPSTAMFRAEFGPRDLVAVAFPTTPPGWNGSAKCGSSCVRSSG